jgi:hypothetical protein
VFVRLFVFFFFQRWMEEDDPELVCTFVGENMSSIFMEFTLHEMAAL